MQFPSWICSREPADSGQIRVSDHLGYPMLTYVDPDPYRAHTHIANNPRYGSGPWMSLKLCPAASFWRSAKPLWPVLLEGIEFHRISWYILISHLTSLSLFSHIISSLTSPHVYLSLSPSFSPQMCYLLCTTRVYFMCILIYTAMHNKLGSWDLGLRCHHCSPVRYFCGALQHYAMIMMINRKQNPWFVL